MIRAGLTEICRKPIIELPRRDTNELHFITEDGDDVVKLAKWAKEEGFYLCTMVANDERFLEDHVFKLYYVFSASDGKLVIIEHPLTDPKYPFNYASISKYFSSVIPLEKEALDLFGLSPIDNTMNQGFVLHDPYPPDLFPLRPRRSMPDIIKRIEENKTQVSKSESIPLPEGVLSLPVGPIHAGIIEAGQFRFLIAGEIVEDLELRLGYKHRGIEKLFQTQYSLEEGWKLAERISGDSSFAHSMAYCQAVESLAGMEPGASALHWRGLFLEMERLHNHIGDVAAMVHDMAFDLAASRIAVLREKSMQLNADLGGHRLLRNINRPGGVELTRSPNLSEASDRVRELTDQFLSLGKLVLEMPACRNRMIMTGVLSLEQATELGATGLVARASGLGKHDFRLRHAKGVYAARPEMLAEINATIESGEDGALRDSNGSASPTTSRRAQVLKEELRGDVFARLAFRIAEVETSARIIEILLRSLTDFESKQLHEVTPLVESLRRIASFEFGLGYVEGWRGDIMYWVMKGPGNTIFRCKVRDPSLFNWPALVSAVILKDQQSLEEGRSSLLENLLADFPLINKSFNLSCSGNDL